MLRPGISVKKRHGGGGFALGFALGCGCKDAKSVSVCASSPSPSGAGTSTTTDQTRRRGGGASRTTDRSASTATDTPTSASSSSLWEDAVADLGCDDDVPPRHTKTETPQSFSGLLRELSELEQSVVSWGARKSPHRRDNEKLSTPPPPPQEQCRKATRSGGAKDHCDSLVVQVEVGLDGSLAVVKQSEDPLGDFRESMVQMIVENGVVGGQELREMLRRFLALNAPHHHDAILRAFAEIWDAVFAAAASFDPVRVPPNPAAAAYPAHKHARREPPVARTPPRHRHYTPSAWRV